MFFIRFYSHLHTTEWHIFFCLTVSGSGLYRIKCLVASILILFVHQFDIIDDSVFNLNQMQRMRCVYLDRKQINHRISHLHHINGIPVYFEREKYKTFFFFFVEHWFSVLNRKKNVSLMKISLEGFDLFDYKNPIEWEPLPHWIQQKKLNLKYTYVLNEGKMFKNRLSLCNQMKKFRFMIKSIFWN